MSTSLENLEVAEADETGDDEIVLHLSPVIQMSEDQFFHLCQVNELVRMERNAEGDILIMPPVGMDSGERESDIVIQLGNWAKRNATGKTYGPSTGFTLPNNAVRSADAAWVRLTRWKKLTAEERKKFAPVCPNFVIELRSETDRLRTLKEKLKEYIDNGAELGLLVDPLKRKVHIYRPGREPEILDDPATVPCDPELPGFALDLREIW